MRRLYLLSLTMASSLLSTVAAAAAAAAAKNGTSSWLEGAEPPTKASKSKPSSNSSTKTITVGKGAFTFVPDSVTANKGDKIVFEFWSSGHAVARADFGFPCMPYEYNVPNGEGFWSGNLSDVSSGSRPTYSITVNDTSPIFYYCSAPGSCKGNNMVGVINPNDTQTLEEQKAAISPNILELSPGDPIPSETSGGTEQPTATTITSSASSTTTTTATPSSGGLSSGGIAGIAIGAAAILLLAGALAYVCRCQGRFEKGYKHTILQGSSSVRKSSSGTEPMILPAPVGNSSNYAADTNLFSGATSPMGQYVVTPNHQQQMQQDQSQNQSQSQSQSQSRHMNHQSVSSVGGPWSTRQSPTSPISPLSSQRGSTFQFQAYRPPDYMSSAPSNMASTRAPFHTEDFKYEAAAPGSRAPAELAAGNENHLPRAY